MRPADLLIVAAALALEALLLWRLWTPGGSAELAIVQGPQQRLELPLHEDADHALRGPLGVSRLRIRNGAIAFVDSPCQRKLCIRSGAHARHGASTACVPNRISLHIAGAATEGIDAWHR